MANTCIEPPLCRPTNLFQIWKIESLKVGEKAGKNRTLGDCDRSQSCCYWMLGDIPLFKSLARSSRRLGIIPPVTKAALNGVDQSHIVRLPPMAGKESKWGRNGGMKEEDEIVLDIDR